MFHAHATQLPRDSLFPASSVVRYLPMMRRCFGCTHFGSPAFAVLSHAAARSAGARLRNLGVLRTDVNWLARLAVCRSCPLRTMSKGVPHCGKPLLQQLGRTPAQGCGCPLTDKAKRPAEHCPLTPAGAVRSAAKTKVCDCKWCAAQASPVARHV